MFSVMLGKSLTLSGLGFLVSDVDTGLLCHWAVAAPVKVFGGSQSLKRQTKARPSCRDTLRGQKPVTAFPEDREPQAEGTERSYRVNA